MRKIISTLIVMIAGALGVANGQVIERGTKTMGIRGGYVTLNHAPAAGLELSYAFSEHFVLAPSVDYVFQRRNLDGLMFNLDYQGPWRLCSSGKWYFYHILGVNYASWSSHAAGMESSDDDVTTRYNRFGLDFGAGFHFNVTPTLRLSAQGKYNLLKDHNTGIFNLGISYVF